MTDMRFSSRMESNPSRFSLRLPLILHEFAGLLIPGRVLGKPGTRNFQGTRIAYENQTPHLTSSK